MLKKFLNLKLILVGIILSGLLSFPGCTQDRGGSGGLETLVGLGILAWQLGVFDDNGDSNNPPIISTVTASPNTISAGGTVLVSCVAYDSDSGDTLTYIWSAGSGTLESPTNPSTVWTAPTDNTGTYYIKVTVTDGKTSVTGQVQVTVTL